MANDVPGHVQMRSGVVIGEETKSQDLAAKWKPGSWAATAPSAAHLEAPTEAFEAHA